MKLTIYLYEWIEKEQAFKISEPEYNGFADIYVTEPVLVDEILTQNRGNRRYVAADPVSYFRIVQAIAMKVFVHYRED